jgi:hypothetical protein
MHNTEFCLGRGSVRRGKTKGRIKFNIASTYDSQEETGEKLAQATPIGSPTLFQQLSRSPLWLPLTRR